MSARANPFSTDRLERIRFRPQGWTWPQLFERLDATGYTGAIVGPKGTGKTTLLGELIPRLAANGRRVRCLQLKREKRSLPPRVLAHLRASLLPSDIVILDGAEQMPLWRWWIFRRTVRGSGGLIITTHRSMRLPTLVRCTSSAGLLHALAGDLCYTLSLNENESNALYSRHRGNIREGLRELYDRYEKETAA